MAFVLTARERRWLAFLVVAVVGIRMATLGAYPLMDTTEARYGEIARKMLETADWLVPQFDYGVPFWGKPPLSTWLSALSLAVFGINEFAARLPSLLLLGGCGALVVGFARARGGGDQALWTLALFAATGIVFVAAGSVMTDPALAFGTTLSMAGFWNAVYGPPQARRGAGVMFFSGLLVGLLAKGPVALVLTFVPIGALTLWRRTWPAVWQRLPWIVGGAATFGLAALWYAAAERASPGFLDYFLVGEHWRRFVEPGWKGDLYGSAHARPRGMIWLFWLAAALPWSIGALAWLVRAAMRRRDRLRALAEDPWRLYLLLWTVTPMLFFTPAGNILVTYVLPGLPAFALLVGDLWRPEHDTPATASSARALRPPVRQAVVAAAIAPLALVVGIVALHARLESEYSQKALVRDYGGLRTGSEARLIYFPRRPHSAEFYSRGKAMSAPDADRLRALLDDATPDFLAIREHDLAALPAPDRARMRLVGAYGDYRLLREVPPR